MKKSLLMITNGFPFGESERGFLSAEFPRLAREFHVHILAHSQEPLLYPIPEGVEAERYEYSPVFRPRRLTDLPSFFQLLTQPFRPSVFSELRRALRRCPSGQAVARVKSILGASVSARQLEKRLEKITRADGTALVYTYWCTPATLAAVRVKKRCPGLKAATRFHGYDLYQERRSDGWQPFRREIFQGCDRLIFAAEAGKRYTLETWGRQWEPKCAVCYLGSREMTPVRPSGGALTLVSCSNLIPLKRVDLIIAALALLPGSIRVDWHHFGDGTEREALAALAVKTLPPNVRWKFWGSVPNRKLDGLYQELKPDLFLTATSTEGGVPVSIQEAFSCGIPAVATNTDSLPEIVREGGTGFLVPKDPAPEKLAAAIRRFYELPSAEKAAMSAAARALWEEAFDAEKNGAQMTDLLEAVCRDHPAASGNAPDCAHTVDSIGKNAPPPADINSARSLRAPSGGTLTLVSCSNLIPLKRVDLIIAALALLPGSIRVDWSHFGGGPERESLTALAEKTLPPNVRWKFWGGVPNESLDGFYQELKPDLFLTASSTEGLPISILEAFSACIPAAATAVGGIPEIVRDGETGFLLPENPAPEELAAAIRRFYELPPAEKAAMSAAARALWEDAFDAEKNADRLAGLFRRLLSTKGDAL